MGEIVYLHCKTKTRNRYIFKMITKIFRIDHTQTKSIAKLNQMILDSDEAGGFGMKQKRCRCMAEHE
jgi:hypothetical protein